MGNEQPVAIKDKAADLESRIKSWMARPAAKPASWRWSSIRASCRRSAGMQPHPDQIEAIRTHRLLLSRRIRSRRLQAIAGCCVRPSTVHADHAAAYHDQATLAGNEKLK